MSSLFDLDVIGLERLQTHIQDVRNRVRRVRTTGVDRCGKALHTSKIRACKAGLYSGTEVAPNKWRYGWEYLGGPATYRYTKNLLNSHRLGARVSGDIDKIEVSLDMQKAPYAKYIHGPMEGKTFFVNKFLDKLVETRPWMKITDEEKNESMNILNATYWNK